MLTAPESISVGCPIMPEAGAGKMLLILITMMTLQPRRTRVSVNSGVTVRRGQDTQQVVLLRLDLVDQVVCQLDDGVLREAPAVHDLRACKGYTVPHAR